MKKDFRIFISQPMRNRTIQEIENERCKIIEEIEKKYKNTPNKTYIYSIITTEPDNIVRNEPLWYFAKSVNLISTADLVVLGGEWEKARGCRMEYELCQEYDVPVRSVII